MIASAMSSLRLRFIERIETLHPEIQARLVALGAGTDVAGALDSLLIDVHRIAGLAGSFGFFDLGTRAAETESAIRSAVSHGLAEPELEEARRRLAALSDAMGLTLDANTERLKQAH